MRWKVVLLTLIMSFVLPIHAETKKRVEYRKTQEVHFEGSEVDGMVRTPDGAYMVEKKGVQFMPLYKVRQQFDQNIKESVDYLR